MFFVMSFISKLNETMFQGILQLDIYFRDCYIEREEKESANDRNDRAIRVACWWYQQHFSVNNQNVVLLTNDIANRDKARELKLDAYTGNFFTCCQCLHVNWIPF